MTSVVVIGLQWGDEGKGKIVDFFVPYADAIVRFQGGNNAGHTVVHGEKNYKLSLLPSGVLSEGKMCLISGGVVVDPWALLAEIEGIARIGISISPQNLGIAENVSLILPWHIDLDGAREGGGALEIGTTRRGIGPTYEDRVGRRSIRVCDLRDGKKLRSRLQSAAIHHNALRRYFGLCDVDIEATATALEAISSRILSYSMSVPSCLRYLSTDGRSVMYEGAQGAMLDIDHGTYPFVTSSNTIAAQAAVSCGVAMSDIDCVFGVAKAYTTRVGNGPFPSELSDDLAERLGVRGDEFGTVTARKRRVGWFDAVQIREVVRCNDVKQIALTKIDVLDGLEQVGICTGYELRGRKINYVPLDADDLAEVKPIIEMMDGWPADTTRQAKHRSDLAPNAQSFIARIEQLSGAPVTVISYSPDRDDTIVEVNPFALSTRLSAANS